MHLTTPMQPDRRKPFVLLPKLSTAAEWERYPEGSKQLQLGSKLLSETVFSTRRYTNNFE
ncbi:MAG: hypothetical protein V7K48_07455 [Nostoc sp.]|uniref:hypothetical protein n=1 Tax=Nostoc sp. TaxID=1180 RepID=UPI002FFD2E59